MNHQHSKRYDTAFRSFMRGSNEKERIAAELLERMRIHRTRSVLDIGAGTGEIAQRLQPYVERYLAVEQRNDYVATLRRRGLNVLQARFPCEIPRAFSLVLLCHSLPSDPRTYHAMLEGAWSLVTGGGHLIFVTYDSTPQSIWFQFLVQTGFRDPNYRNGRLSDMRDFVHTLEGAGNVDECRINSVLMHDNERIMIDSLAFVFSDAREDQFREFIARPAVRHELQRFRNERGYVFPFEHILVDITRTRA